MDCKIQEEMHKSLLLNEVKVCPKCENLVYYSSYFGTYVCRHCGYKIKYSTCALCNQITSSDFTKCTHCGGDNNEYSQ